MAGHLFDLMATNSDIVVLTGDLGFGLFNKIRDMYPKRFFNVGASEQSLVDIAVGLAMSGKIPVIYSITPFLLRRAYEGIKLYVDEERIPVIIVGGGRNKDYLHDGASHWCEEDKDLMKIMKNIKTYWPSTKEEVPRMLDKIIKSKKPSYLNLTR